MSMTSSLRLNGISMALLALALVSGIVRAETLPSAAWAFDLLARVEQWQSVEPLDFLRNANFTQGGEANRSVIGDEAVRRRMQAHYRRMPMYFEPNVGQIAAGVKFMARGPGYALFLTADEAVLALRPSRSLTEPVTTLANSGAVIRTRLEGTTDNLQSQPAGIEKLPSVSHYLLGNDPKRWHTNVPHYAQVRYPNVYPGIDLVYYGNPEHLEHDFIVAPGADPSVIRWVISGAQQVRVNAAGDLVLTVPGGEVVQQAPRIYQMIEGQQQWVAGRYVLHEIESAAASTIGVATAEPRLEALQIGFEVAQYDRQQPLVIDPVLVYSTYLGGIKDDYGTGIAVDNSGCAYVTGGTAAIDFPVTPTPPAIDPALAGVKTQDAFVSKFCFSPPGYASLSYSTYLGGSDDKDDIGYGVAVEPSGGNTCVTGMTASQDFPVGGGTPAGGKDAFIVCLDMVGQLPVFSTYLGGAKDDEGRGIAMNWPMIYVTGQTNSTDFLPKGASVTAPFQPALLGGIDAFILQINAVSGMPPIYSTYLGGAKDDKGAAIAIDNNGSIYVTGSTASANFPVTGASAFDSALGGSLDGFIAKIEPGSMGMYSLAYSAYVGGSSTDSGAGVAVDSNHDVYVTGATSSSSFPVTPNAAQANYGGSGDAFIIKVDPLLTGSTSLIYSTYLGGKGADSGASIAVIHRPGVIHTYVTGATASDNFPVTSDAIDNTLGGSGDAFIAQISEDGDRWLYGTYLGGDNGVDSGAGIAADATNIYVTGAAASSDFPITANGFDTVNGSSKDAFVVKLEDALVTLTIVKAGNGAGTVASQPPGIACGSFCSATYSKGTYITLTATAANGSKFDGWNPVNCGYMFALNASTTCTATFILNPVPPPVPPPGTPPIIPFSIVLSGDYDGNGTADLVWHHAVSGQTYGLLLNGFAITNAKMFHHEPNTAWRIVQNGDLDGNGQDDLLWWNNLTGQVYWMPMNGLNIAGGGQIYQETDTHWQIVAVGDLNGDGKDDLIWWHDIYGWVYGMLMKGGAIDSQGMIYHEPNTNWQILAARDFNGDGKADLLWRNSATGQVYLMPMSGLTIAGGAMVYHEPNLAWSIVAVGDLNNDKKNDLVWWHEITGQVYGMLMNGYIIGPQGQFYLESDTNWRIVASGDYTGDGKADLLWRHSITGQVYEMPMDGLTVIGGQQIYQELNPDWRIVADAKTVPLPPPSRSLPGASRFAPLEGEPLNPYQPFEGEPVNAGTLPAQ